MKPLSLIFILISFFSFSQTEIKNIDIQSEFLKLLNEYRVSRNLSTLILSDDLYKTAKILSDYYCYSGIEKVKDENGNTKFNVTLQHGNHPDYEKHRDVLIAVNPDLASLFYYERNKSNRDKSNFYLLENVGFIAGREDLENSPQKMADILIKMWKNSLPHDRAMLSEYSTQIGISVSFIDLEYEEKVISYDGSIFPPKKIVTFKKISERFYFASILFLEKE